MGVVIPVGFGQWTLPFSLAADLEPMVITCGFQDDGVTNANSIADQITNPLFATPTFAASSYPVQYTIGPAEVVVNRTMGTFAGVGTTIRAGTGAQQVLPNNCAILVSKLTNRGGRRGRGRLYLPPAFIAEGNVTVNGSLLASVRDSITLDFETWRAAVTATPFDLQLLHSDPPVGSPPPPDPIVGFICSGTIATQRTRLRP